MTACKKAIMASREELLQSIQPGMKLDKAFFLKIYGYEISFPGFRDTAIKALEDAGCSRALEYYSSIVSEYEKERREQMKEAGAWYLGKCDKEWKKLQKGSEELRKQETYSADTAQSNYLQQQKEKLLELRKKLRALN